MKGLLKFLIFKSNNLINRDDLEEGSITDASGANVEYATRCRTKNYIPVNSSTVYTLKKDSLSSNYWGAHCYDADYVWIAMVYNSPSTQGSFTTSSNCAFIRLKFDSTLEETYTGHVMLNIGAIALPYEPF